MNNTAFRDFADAMEDAAHDIVRACRRGATAIVAMPWPAVLACCIALALLAAVLPLALCLFVLFMAVKFVIAAFAVDRNRAVRERHHEQQYGKQ